MILILFFYFIRMSSTQAPSTELKYVLNFDSEMACCDEESAKFVDCSDVSVDRYNDSVAYMYGNIEFLQEFSDDIVVELILEKEASGKYEAVFNYMICNVCDELKKGPDSDYHGYIKYFGIPEECPFAAGKYPVKKFVIDTDDMQLDSKSEGFYQAFVKMYRNPERDCKTLEFFCCLNIKMLIELLE